MKSFLVTVWVVVAISAGLPCQADWIQFRAPCGFAAEFPETPRETVAPSNIPNGAFPATVYETSTKHGEFRVRCQVIPAGFRAAVNETEWFRFLGDFYQSQAGYEVISETDLEIGSFPARKFRFEDPNHHDKIDFLIILGNQVIYVVAAAREGGEGALAIRSEEVAARFLDSFSVGDVSQDFLTAAESPKPLQAEAEPLSAREEYERGVREGWQDLNSFRRFWTGAGPTAWVILSVSLMLVLSGPSLLEKGQARLSRIYFILCLAPILIGLVYIPINRAELRDVMNSAFGYLPAAKVQYYIGLGIPESLAALVLGTGAAGSLRPLRMATPSALWQGQSDNCGRGGLVIGRVIISAQTVLPQTVPGTFQVGLPAQRGILWLPLRRPVR